MLKSGMDYINKRGLDSKVRGANMGPYWVLSAPGGPHVSPINLAVREVSIVVTLNHYDHQYHISLSCNVITTPIVIMHYDVINWKHFPRYWPFVRGIHRSPVNSSHKGQWRGALVFSLICTRMNGWVNNGDAGDFRRHRAHYDVTVMGVCYYSVSFRLQSDPLGHLTVEVW